MDLNKAPYEKLPGPVAHSVLATQVIPAWSFLMCH